MEIDRPTAWEASPGTPPPGGGHRGKTGGKRISRRKAACHVDKAIDVVSRSFSVSQEFFSLRAPCVMSCRLTRLINVLKINITTSRSLHLHSYWFRIPEFSKNEQFLGLRNTGYLRPYLPRYLNFSAWFKDCDCVNYRWSSNYTVVKWDDIVHKRLWNIRSKITYIRTRSAPVCAGFILQNQSRLLVLTELHAASTVLFCFKRFCK